MWKYVEVWAYNGFVLTPNPNADELKLPDDVEFGLRATRHAKRRHSA